MSNQFINVNNLSENLDENSENYTSDPINIYPQHTIFSTHLNLSNDQNISTIIETNENLVKNPSNECVTNFDKDQIENCSVDQIETELSVSLMAVDSDIDISKIQIDEMTVKTISNDNLIMPVTDEVALILPDNNSRINWITSPNLFCKAEKIFTKTNNNYLRGCLWSPDGTCILSNSNDNVLRVFELPTLAYENSTYEQQIVETEIVAI